MSLQVTRRDFLRLAGYTAVAHMTPYRLAPGVGSVRALLGALNNRPPEEVFGLSVASGDPTPTGVVLWTRVNPDQWLDGELLAFEVALDEAFTQVVAQGVVDSADFDAVRDFTLKLDLDGQLQPDMSYYYRFTYRETTSRVGRCHTLPDPNSAPEMLKLGLVTCQSFGNGYYPAYYHLTQESDLRFVLHLGDYIYENAQPDPPFKDRGFMLPSQQNLAHSLEDYRFLYRTYRSDPFLQLAHEQLTFIAIWDDHETANDCYWDYATDGAGVPDHPFVDDPPEVRNGLKRAAMQAWSEYIPGRPTADLGASHPHDFLSIYRSFRYGDLVELFMTDERTYRTAPPCGLQFIGERYATRGCEGQLDPANTMLGVPQRDWLVSGLLNSTALWKVWGNEVFVGPLKAKRISAPLHKGLFYTMDGWDGFEYERQLILQALKAGGVENLVALTGDLHAYLAAYLKVNYETDPFNITPANLVGVEFMTPSVTSATLNEEFAEIGLPIHLTQPVVRAMNPHIKFFDADHWGYATVTFTRADCYYDAYTVDKTVNDASASRLLLKRLRAPLGQVRLWDETPA